jgi:hypothetical protein
MSDKTLEINITADANDGDYITQVTPISEEELDTIKSIEVSPLMKKTKLL